MTEGDRARTIHFVLLNAFGILLFGTLLHGRLKEWGGDNLVVLPVGKALTTGQGYVDLHLGRPIPHAHDPPLFPVLLVPFVASGASICAMKLLVAWLSLLGLNANLVLFSRTLGPRPAWLVTVGVLVCPVFLDPALSVMSDGPASLLTTLALLAAHRMLPGPEARRWVAVAAGLWIGLSCCTEERVLDVIDANPAPFRALDTGRLARAHRILPPSEASQTPQVSQESP